MKYLQNFKTHGIMNESISSDDKTYFMTLTEYKEKVSPLLKEYRKFLKKNDKYFKNKNYSGLEQYTFPEYMEIELESLKKQKYSLGEDYIKKKWLEKGKVEDKVPSKILSEYKSFIKKFGKLFGEENINKVESDETNSNKRSVRRAIDDGTYVESLIDGFSPSKLVEIFNSVGLKISKRILDMKHKVENEGYTRKGAERGIQKSAEFAKSIEKIIKEDDVIKQLKDRKKRSIESLCDEFDKSKYNTIYDFAVTLNKSNPTANSTLNQLYKKENYYDKSKPTRIQNFDKIVENMLNDYVDGVISRFINRSNDKLSVLISKIGIPQITMGDFSASGDIEGTLDLAWDNGFKLKLHTRIILAGGTYQVVLHERYLFTFYKDGKKIEIEQIDKSF